MPSSNNNQKTISDIIARDNGRALRAAEVVGVKDAEKRTVEVAFSSEVEVQRWYGIEILDHSPGAIMEDRLRNGAAVLVDHGGDQVAVVDEYLGVGPDRKARAVLRFSRGVRASEVFQDIQDGIRKHISVGYRVLDAKLNETRDGGDDVYLMTRWEPYEISIVSIPADVSVGIGRSAIKTPEEDGENIRDTSATGETQKSKNPSSQGKVMPDQVPAVPVDHEASRKAAVQAERDRTRTILEMGEKYGEADMAREFSKTEKGVEEFRGALLDKVNTRSAKPLREKGGADIGLSDKEAQSFSFMRAMNALANPADRGAQEAAAFEFEASRAAAAKMGKTGLRGIMVPQDVLKRSLNTSKSGSGSGDTGGYAIATELLSSSFIDILRVRTVAMQLGTTMGGLIGNIDIPRQTDKAVAGWIGEDAQAAEDVLELGDITMTPKTVAAKSEITRKMLQQNSFDVEALVRRDLAIAAATAIDYAAFFGTGSSNQPRGIANTSGINLVDFASAGSLPTYAEIVQMESEIAADNADVNSMAYVLGSAIRGHLKTTQKFTGTNGAPVWEPNNTVNGYRTEVTNQIATGLFFGNFADLLIGMWGGLELTVDPYTYSDRGRIRVNVFQDVDIALRRVESFCRGVYVP